LSRSALSTRRQTIKLIRRNMFLLCCTSSDVCRCQEAGLYWSALLSRGCSALIADVPIQAISIVFRMYLFYHQCRSTSTGDACQGTHSEPAGNHNMRGIEFALLLLLLLAASAAFASSSRTSDEVSCTSFMTAESNRIYQNSQGSTVLHNCWFCPEALNRQAGAVICHT
jgi:hypothetical protein